MRNLSGAKILVVQTAFIGDAILASAFLESLYHAHPDAELHILLRKGNEGIFDQHPYLKRVWIWEKNRRKNRHLFQLVKEVREAKFDFVFCLQRFFSAGLLTAFSGAKTRVAFDKNPWAFAMDKSFPHLFYPKVKNLHEIERNHELLKDWKIPLKNPKLYPAEKHQNKVEKLLPSKPFVTIAPASVWFTKQFPKEKWVQLMKQLSDYAVFLVGGKNDFEHAAAIQNAAQHPHVANLCGQLNLLDTAELMKKAHMNYVNDSAPLHLASAVNAKVTAVFCSTLPEFGFTPLSEKASVVETKQKLSCRPCGMHGHSKCPEGHFKCAQEIETSAILASLEK